MIRITIEYDRDCENPLADWDCQWTLYSFNRRHSNYRDPDEFTDDASIQDKIKTGLAFWCDYFEHGQCAWSLHGGGMQCQWDTAQFAGLLVWENAPDDTGAKTYENRAKDAKACLDVYTEWCNGHCYYYSIERIAHCEHCGGEMVPDDLDSCGGFIGDEHVAEAILEATSKWPNEEFEVVGDASWIADYNDVYPKPERTAK